MTEPGAAFLSVLSTVSGQVALAVGGIQGFLRPQQELCTLHTVISPAESPGSPQEEALLTSHKCGWKVFHFHVTLCVVSDPATRGSPGNNQAEKALLSHSTLVAKHATVFAIT